MGRSAMKTWTTIGGGVVLGAMASAAIASDTCWVTLRASDPAWNRPRDTGSTTSVGCNAQALDSQNDGEKYRAVKIRTTVVEQLSITATSQTAGTFDPFIGVYCAAFNPAQPLSNLISLDDDSAGWPNASIPASRNIQLTPNTDYYVVVSAYSATGQSSLGTVLLTLGGQAKFSQTLPGCCKADFNQNGVVNVQDIFDYLAAWFASNPAADVNASSTVTVQDIFDYLALWFAGC